MSEHPVHTTSNRLPNPHLKRNTCILYLFVCIYWREREKERETDRQRARERKTEQERDSQADKEREIERDRGSELQKLVNKCCFYAIFIQHFEA